MDHLDQDCNEKASFRDIVAKYIADVEHRRARKGMSRERAYTSQGAWRCSPLAAAMHSHAKMVHFQERQPVPRMLVFLMFRRVGSVGSPSVVCK
jgi:hypothetical protein